MIKITRNTLSIIIAVFGVLIIVFSLLQHFLGFGFNEGIERRITDIVFVIALILFFRNRKLAKEEKEAKLKTERANRLAKKEIEEVPSQDENGI